MSNAMHSVRMLSSGTLATLTDLTDGAALDKVYQLLALWADHHQEEDESWQAAWQRFWPWYRWRVTPWVAQGYTRLVYVRGTVAGADEEPQVEAPRPQAIVALQHPEQMPLAVVIFADGTCRTGRFTVHPDGRFTQI